MSFRTVCLRMSQHPIPVFILGSGRSGTTITASLLNHLPGVQIAKETGYIGQNLALLQDIANPHALSRLIREVNSWLEKERWEHTVSVQGFRDFCQHYQFFGSRRIYSLRLAVGFQSALA